MLYWPGKKNIILICLFLLVCVTFTMPVRADQIDIINLKEPLTLDLKPNQLSIADAIKMALLNNPKVSIEKASVLEKEWAIKENKSYLLPNIYVTQNYMASNNPVQAFMMKLSQRNFNFLGSNLNHPGTESNFSTRIGASWSLFDRSIYKKINISELELEIQKQMSRQAIDELVQTVRKAYLDVILAKERVNNAQAILDYANAHFYAVKNKKETGNASKSDFLGSKVMVSSAEEELAKARNDLNLSWIVLSDLVGDETVVGYDLVDQLNESYQVDDIDKLVKYSYLHRPEVAAIESGKKKAVMDLNLAKKSGAFTLNAKGEWGVDTILDDRDIANSFTAGVFINKTLFDGGLKKAQVEQAKAKIDKKNAEIDQIYRHIKVEVVQNYLSYKNAKERVKMVKTMVDDAEESLRAYNERYLVGLSNTVEVESAQSNLHNAKLMKTQALYDLEASIINLQKAVGLSISDILAGKGVMVTSQEADVDLKPQDDSNMSKPDDVDKKDQNEFNSNQNINTGKDKIEFPSANDGTIDLNAPFDSKLKFNDNDSSDLNIEEDQGFKIISPEETFPDMDEDKNLNEGKAIPDENKSKPKLENAIIGDDKQEKTLENSSKNIKYSSDFGIIIDAESNIIESAPVKDDVSKLKDSDNSDKTSSNGTFNISSKTINKG